MEAAFLASLSPAQFEMYKSLHEGQGAPLEPSPAKLEAIREAPLHVVSTTRPKESPTPIECIPPKPTISTGPITALASAATIAAIQLDRTSPTHHRDSPEVDQILVDCFLRMHQQMERKGEMEFERKGEVEVRDRSSVHHSTHAC